MRRNLDGMQIVFASGWFENFLTALLITIIFKLCDIFKLTLKF